MVLQARAGNVSSVASPITTMMLRNIPNKYREETLKEEVNELGFEETYDFVYLPLDAQSRGNVGYAFINFKTEQDAWRFANIFTNHAFRRYHSRKVGAVSVARVQGLEENQRHFQTRAAVQRKRSQVRSTREQTQCKDLANENESNVGRSYSKTSSSTSIPGTPPELQDFKPITFQRRDGEHSGISFAESSDVERLLALKQMLADRLSNGHGSQTGRSASPVRTTPSPMCIPASQNLAPLHSVPCDEPAYCTMLGGPTSLQQFAPTLLARPTAHTEDLTSKLAMIHLTAGLVHYRIAMDAIDTIAAQNAIKMGSRPFSCFN